MLSPRVCALFSLAATLDRWTYHKVSDRCLAQETKEDAQIKKCTRNLRQGWGNRHSPDKKKTPGGAPVLSRSASLTKFESRSDCDARKIPGGCVFFPNCIRIQPNVVEVIAQNGRRSDHVFFFLASMSCSTSCSCKWSVVAIVQLSPSAVP